jgi:isopentenyl-diphosphate delta-isomerase
MGFDCELRRAFGFLYRKELDNRLVEHEYDHVFVGSFDGDPAPDASEVEAWCWLSMGQLRQDLRERPHEYSYWLSVALNRKEWRLLDAFSCVR